MCCVPSKKRRKLSVATLDPEPRREIVSEDPPLESSKASVRCPLTQPRIRVKCLKSKRAVKGLQVTLGGVDLGLTSKTGRTAPLEGGMAPGEGYAEVNLTVAQRLSYKPRAKRTKIKYPALCKGTFNLYVVCLVRPRVKVVLTPGGAAVPGVAVTFAGKDRGATDGGGIAAWPVDEAGIEPDDYPLALAFTPGDAKKYRWQAPVPPTVTVPDEDEPTFTVEVRRLGRPKIELLEEGTLAKVIDVGVKLDAVDFGLTKGNGIAQQPPDADWLEPKEYAVTFDLGAKNDRYVVVEATPKVTVTEGSEATATFHVKPLAAVLVEVLRYDGVAVRGGHVTFTLDGPSGNQNETTADFDGRDEQLARDVRDERKKVTGLLAGAYTVTLANVPALLAAQKPALLSTEVWTMGPDKDGVAKVTLVAGQVKRVVFTLTKIQKIQFIAFNVKPTSKLGGLLPSGKLYLTHADADVDIGARAVILKNAIKKAVKPSTGTHTEEYVLKVFMAPEFYWRGTEGAYPIEKMSHIMDEMREETEKPAYKDWLFVFGTALGYLPRGGASATRTLAVTGATGLAATSFTLVNHVGSKDLVDVCKRIPANWDLGDLLQVPEYRWTLKQGLKEAHVVKCTAGADQYTLDVNAAIDFADGPIHLLEPQATEVFNVALVQKGGPGAGVAGLRESIVYKEDVSAIDFLGVMYGKHSLFHQKSGDNRKIEIHGEVSRVLPTEGARDILGGNPNVPTVGGVSEVTSHGLGGGSIFAVDGITFGLEICRDHLQSKLKNYFVGNPTATPPILPTASPGDPKVQVQLIPSWGASIDPNAITGVDGVLVFNVDGPAGSNAGAVAGAVQFECPFHPGPTTAPSVCTTGPHYKCFGLSAIPGDCPHCGEPRPDTIAGTGAPFHCASTRHYFWTRLTCNVGSCTAATKLSSRYKCPACNKWSPTPGNCTHGPCVTKPPLKPMRYCDAVPHVHTTAAACACGAVPKPARLHYCEEHDHTQATSGACTACGLVVRSITTFKRPGKDITTATGGAPTTVSDAPGDYTTVIETKDVFDPTSPTDQKKNTRTTVTANITPQQKDYFAAKGKIVVYPWMDVPAAETV